jgi:hypothetical protein
MSFLRCLLVALVLTPAIAQGAVPLEAGLYFQPLTINVGETSAMTIEITNPNDVAATALAVSDSYPGGIFNASPANTTSTCGGTVNAPAGSAFTFSGGSLAAHSTCVITVDVLGAQGFWVNALDPGSVTSSSVPANATFSTALLIVNAPATQGPGVAMAFTPASIHSGKTATLSIVLTNPNGNAMTGVAFAAEYPPALINTPDGATSSCGGTAVTKPGSRTLTFSGGAIPAGGTCGVEVVLRGSTPGTYTVTLPAGSVTTATHPASAQGATAALTVSSSGK